MIVPINEQETTISFTRDGDKAIVYTSDKTMLTKLHKLVEKNPKEWKRIDEGRLNGNIVSETFECPKKLISLRTATPTFVMSDEQKHLAAKHLKEWMERQK
jgi:hypothetical protein